MIKTIIFDLDGTLLYTLEDLQMSINYALKFLGYSPRSLEEIRLSVGNGVRQLVINSLPTGVSSDVMEKCFEIFLSHYEIHMDDHTRVYEGFESVLDWLVCHNYKLAVLSNKHDEGVQTLVKKHLSKWIKIAQGETPSIRKKPFPDGVHHLLQIMKTTPEETLFIGDSEVDVRTAVASKTSFLGVTWGYRSKDVLLSEGALNLINYPNELIHFLESEKKQKTD